MQTPDNFYGGKIKGITRNLAYIAGLGCTAIWLSPVFENNSGRRNRFAHSSPVFVEVPGRPLHPRREEIAYLIQRVEEEIARNQNVLSPAALDEYRAALKVYQDIARSVR